MKNMKKIKFAICTLMVISVFASAVVVVFAAKTAEELTECQKEADNVIAVEAWMKDQGSSVLNELRKSVNSWKERMDQAIEAGDFETADKCAAIIRTQEKLISDFEEYINSEEFREHADNLSEEDRSYIDSLLDQIKNMQ